MAVKNKRKASGTAAGDAVKHKQPAGAERQRVKGKDLYEAEDSDPEEIKHARRFDVS